MGCDAETPFRFVTIPGEPRSKARPRFHGKKGFSDPVQAGNEQVMKFYLRQQFRNPLTGNLGVACFFYRSSRQPVDTDNMLKQVLDAGTGVCWGNDRQVTAVAGVTHMDRDNPRLIVGIGFHESTLDREASSTYTCRCCGKPFTSRTLSPSEIGRTHQYCTPECAKVFRKRGLVRTARCCYCEKDFLRATAAARYCSDGCKAAAVIRARQAFGEMSRQRRIHPDAHCEACGKQVSRPEYKRCRACWQSQTVAE